MTRDEAKSFGEMWLEVNEDSKDATTYKFFKIAMTALKEEPAPFDFELFQAGLMDMPEGITNGEVLKALLPDLKVCSADSRVVEYANADINIMASRKWLDSPYKKGSE